MLCNVVKAVCGASAPSAKSHAILCPSHVCVLSIPYRIALTDGIRWPPSVQQNTAAVGCAHSLSHSVSQRAPSAVAGATDYSNAPACSPQRGTVYCMIGRYFCCYDHTARSTIRALWRHQEWPIVHNVSFSGISCRVDYTNHTSIVVAVSRTSAALLAREVTEA